MEMAAIFPVAICLLLTLIGAILAAGVSPEGSTQIDAKVAADATTPVVDKEIEENRPIHLLVDGETIDIDPRAARLSNVLNEWIEENERDGAVTDQIPVPQTKPATLSLLIKWCEQHKDKVPPFGNDGWRKTDRIPDWVRGISSAEDDPMIKFVEQTAGASGGSANVAQEEEKENKRQEKGEEENRESARVPIWADKLLKKNRTTFYELITVSNHLDAKVLLNILTETVRFHLMWRSAEHIRSIFGFEPNTHIIGNNDAQKNKVQQQNSSSSSDWRFELDDENDKQPVVDFQIGHASAALEDEPNARRQRKNAEMGMEIGQSSGTPVDE